MAMSVPGAHPAAPALWTTLWTTAGAHYGGEVTLSIAVSPCPNHTFLFHALVHRLVPGAPAFDVTLADVDVTNTAAERRRFDLVKESYAALSWLLDP